jgi:hypothetical protein
MAIPRQQPDASAVAAHHQPVAVVLDLVDPVGAIRRNATTCRGYYRPPPPESNQSGVRLMPHHAHSIDR